MDRRGGPAPSADDLALQSQLYRRQWLRLLLVLALLYAILAVPFPASWTIPRIAAFVGLFWLMFARTIKQDKCPRCQQPMMMERGSLIFRSNVTIFPHRDCPTCFWPSHLTPEQHQRLVVDLEYGDPRLRRRKQRD